MLSVVLSNSSVILAPSSFRPFAIAEGRSFASDFGAAAGPDVFTDAVKLLPEYAAI